MIAKNIKLVYIFILNNNIASCSMVNFEYMIRKLLILFFTVIAIQLFSQENIKFKRYSIDEGLSQGNVNTILQDSKGFMWFGTQDGLNRFDGYEFKVYKPIADDPHSLNNGIVKSMYESRDGRIWVGTAGGGLNVYDKITDTFKSYMNDPQDITSLSNNAVYSIFEDKDTVLWVGTFGGGVCRFDYKSETFTRFQNDPKDPFSLSGNAIRAIFEDHDGELWIGVDGAGLNKFDRRKKRFIRYQHDPNDSESLGSDIVLTVLVDNDGRFWVGSWAGGISHFDPKTGKAKVYKKDPTDPTTINSNETFSFCRTSNGQLWVCTRDGLDYFDEKTEIFHHFRNDPLIPTSISHNVVIYLYEDRSGVLWVGTEGGGINTIDLKKKQFVTVKNDFKDSQSLNDNEVTAMHYGSDNQYYLATRSGGVNVFDLNTHKCSFIMNDPNNPNSLCSNFIQAIEEDIQGNFWFGSNGAGLSKYNPQTGIYTNYVQDLSDPEALHNNAITAVVQDRYGLVWIGTYGGGIENYNYKTNKFKTYTIDKENQMMNVVLSVIEDSDGVIWGGTSGHGLIKYERSKDKFVKYEADENNPNSISSNIVTTLYEGDEGIIWVGTGGAGIDKFEKATGKFTNYNKAENGLISDMISGILADDEGNLWITTVKGMSKFSISQESVLKNYDREDGLQDNDFVANSALKSPSGLLFFGGRKGFNYFHPDSIKDNPTIPSVAITDLKIFNESQKPGESKYLDKAIDETSELELSYKQYVFSFEFSSLHYATPSKNQYKYKMEGFDDDWVTTTFDRRFANYTNLPGGDYTFRVIASNNDGIWNEEGTAIKVTVVPPFYKTIWFYILVFVVVGSAVYALFKYREKQARLHREQLQKKIDEAIDEVEEQKKEILKQNDELQVRQKEDEQRRWFNEGLAKFADILRQNKDSIDKLSHEVLSNLIRYIGAAQGGIYVVNDEIENEKFLQLISSYAYNSDRMDLDRIEIGETLVGNCFVEKKTKYLKEFPDYYLNIESSLGSTLPKVLLLIPLRLDELIFGVMEISSLKEITPFEIEFVEKLAESVTSQLFTTRISIKTQELLLQSQQQAEELRAQEEEARQNIEEMQTNREEALRLKSEAMGYLNSMNHSIIRADFTLDGQLEYANTRFLDYFGYKSKDAYGMYVVDFFQDEDKKDFLQRWDALLKGSKHIEETYNHKTKTGVVALLSTFTTVKDLNGNIQKILYLGLDVAKQDEIVAIDSVELRAIDQFVLRMELEPDGTIVDVNDRFLLTLGYKEEELIDLNIEAIYTKEELEQFQKAWAIVSEGKTYEQECRRVRADKEEIWLYVTLVPHVSLTKKVTKVSYIALDITKRKKVELDAVRKLNEAEKKEKELTKRIVQLEGKLRKGK